MTETRQHILDVAKALMINKGYTAVGLAEVVAAADVRKGSFYYYFRSKEEFGQALLEQYFSDYLATVDSLLAAEGTAVQRLLAYFRYWADTQGSDLPDGKCLVVKMGSEVCDLSFPCCMFSCRMSLLAWREYESELFVYMPGAYFCCWYVCWHHRSRVEKYVIKSDAWITRW
ncbi:TetR/AcrR family transcriptional regulator [Janthinobacterium sp. CG_23.3]|uniref:TetR/AcrR family transcriptional regulator n=1 Tax=Janthinobacterium sp. CG_23.3 TaxID=3349634 RepID=UPI0038D4A271